MTRKLQIVGYCKMLNAKCSLSLVLKEEYYV
jgi:hypothetical protein